MSVIEVFENKNTIAEDAASKLKATMSEFGWEIMTVLVVNVELSDASTSLFLSQRKLHALFILPWLSLVRWGPGSNVHFISPLPDSLPSRCALHEFFVADRAVPYWCMIHRLKSRMRSTALR